MSYLLFGRHLLEQSIGSRDVIPRKRTLRQGRARDQQADHANPSIQSQHIHAFLTKTSCPSTIQNHTPANGKKEKHTHQRPACFFPPAKSALNVLLVEDDKDLAGFVRQGLEDENCVVKVCHDGGSGLRQAELHSFDIILLDVMMPVLNGFEVTRRIRLQKIRTPILLLTARDSPEDIVTGLDAGADDYLTKPFDFDVLLARIRARTRPASARHSAQMRFADLFLDTEKHEAVRDGQRLDLTRTEFSILECLMRAAGRVVTRGNIIDLVWGDRDISENNLDVFIRYLRSKLDRPGLPRLLHTERGLGYSLREGSD